MSTEHHDNLFLHYQGKAKRAKRLAKRKEQSTKRRLQRLQKEKEHGVHSRR